MELQAPHVTIFPRSKAFIKIMPSHVWGSDLFPCKIIVIVHVNRKHTAVKNNSYRGNKKV